MYKKDSIIVYKNDVCRITEIKKSGFNNLDYYMLTPIYDSSLIISIPKDKGNTCLRNLLTKEEVEKLINKIPNIKELDISIKNIENEYKTLIHSGNVEDLVKIIKTSYLRNKYRKDNKRIISSKDQEYFEKAEKYLYNELSIVLDLSFDEVRKYIEERVK